MKTSKISLVVLLAMTLSLGLAASSARPCGGGMGGGKGCGMMGAMNLSPEQAGKLFDLKEKMRNDTVDQRKQMMVKHFPTSMGAPSVFMPIGPKRWGKGDPHPM